MEQEERMYQVPLEMICRHDRTAEVCRAAVEEDGWQLENVPEEVKTPELCRKALETEAGFGNDRFRLVQHIPSPEVCMEVLKECSKVCPEELYGVAASIRPEVMNGEMADFLLPLDGRCISVLPVHLQTQKRVLVAAETSGMSAVGRGGVPKSLLTPEVYVRCAAHSRESLMMIPWAERSPPVFPPSASAFSINLVVSPGAPFGNSKIGLFCAIAVPITQLTPTSRSFHFLIIAYTV